jgi:2'-5' RNA ligase
MMGSGEEVVAASVVGHRAVNDLPAELIDRWQNRVEPRHDQGEIYWHILLGNDPTVGALVAEAQRRLASFEGLHMTPQRWLHMTTLIVGSTDEITKHQMTVMAQEASELLSGVDPITVTFGRILYHPEGIALGIQPADSLTPVLHAIQAATCNATGHQGRISGNDQWILHVTICYSTSRQPAEPIIKVLGQELPSRQVHVGAVSLVVQRGPERLWDWHPYATTRMRTSANLNRPSG